MKEKIVIGFSYVLAIAAIVISLWRCEPFTIDTVAVLANILTLMVTILLGIIAYNYFIQKSEVDKFKSQVRKEIDKEIFDVYINIMNSFGASVNTSSMFPLGVTVLGKLNNDDSEKISQICNLLNLCYNNMQSDVKCNPIVKSSVTQLKENLSKFNSNSAVFRLLNTIEQ